MATDDTPGSGKKKKHRRAKSNLESQVEVSGSTDQLLSAESSRVLKARQQTQARFESFLQDAVADNSLQEARRKKKKKRTHTSDAVLETIKSGSPIAKPTSQSEENLLQANLYKGDDPAQEGKENKKSYRELLEGSSADPAGLDNKQATPKRSKHKKTRTLTSEQETPGGSQEKPRRRKKPKTPEPKVVGDSARENLGFQDDAAMEGDGPVQPSSTTSKKKGGKARRRLHDPDADRPIEVVKKRTDDGYILSVTVHRADYLKPDLCISHPMVRVHLVDMDTGQYVKKSDSARSVTSYYENEIETPVDYIMPLMTQPYDFKKYKSLMPSWEEVLLFNEIFSYFLSREETDPKVIMFFEVVDFLSMTAANRRKGPSTVDKGWYQVAWAFLKVIGGNGAPNTEKKVRLQLFQPPKASFRSNNTVEVYQWWKQARRVPYPSTLYVTLKGVQPPKTIDPSLRSMFAIQQEKGKVTFEEFSLDAERRAHGMRDGKSNKEPTNWSRLPGQVNRIPNKQKASLLSGKRGCFILKFSHNGRYLACGCADLDSFPILVYEVPSYETRAYLPGHFSIIYDLCWSPDDEELLSASSDGTVRSWDMKTMMTSSIKLFPHPCFVYAAQYHPGSPHIIVTGGYDHYLRVWTKLSEGLNGKLLREIEGHSGFINSVCFDEEGAKMFTADSKGLVIIWNSFIHPQMDTKRKRRGTGGYVYDWTLFKKVAIDELQGNVINSLTLHPNGRKLLVHVRNSVLCMLDLRSYTVMQRYLGASNFKEHIRSTLTACGCFVIAGSEDGYAYVWNTETGDLVSVYTSLGYHHAVSDVQFHPLDHIIAFCSFGDSHPVLVYHYDPKAAKEEAKKFMTPPATPSKQATTSQQSTATPDDVTRHVQMADVAGDVLRMRKVKQKLDSVLETPSSPNYMDTAMMRTPGADSRMFQTPGRPDSAAYPGSTQTSKRPGSVTFQFPESTGRTFRQGMGTNVSLSTWGSDFSPAGYTPYGATAHGPTPAQLAYDPPLSPHAQQHLGASGRFESLKLFSQNRRYGSPQQPDLNGPLPYQTPVGMSWMKRPSLSLNVGETPGSLSVSQLNAAKPKFTFTDSPASHLLQQTPQPRKKVIAMYPYDANRADELTIQPGDVISVLYIDNENWWMGELADGRQGYFPSNYVMEQEDLESESDLKETTVPSTMSDTKREPKANTQMTAVISKSGDLKIVSGPEDSSDAESKLNSTARHRRRHREKEKQQRSEETPVKKASPRRAKKR
ncbi:unnamed protein product [Porites evermanni]|uniref:SH3 domain-containing protein n=1 Tax=Porites evermanni TaxID=104178 RepID=A0ABN8LK78_9CNID|nr:unnamed protein product [Porites evermanni]